jgi:hypothetical protein
MKNESLRTQHSDACLLDWRLTKFAARCSQVMHMVLPAGHVLPSLSRRAVPTRAIICVALGLGSLLRPCVHAELMSGPAASRWRLCRPQHSKREK